MLKKKLRSRKNSALKATKKMQLDEKCRLQQVHLFWCRVHHRVLQYVRGYYCYSTYHELVIILEVFKHDVQHVYPMMAMGAARAAVGVVVRPHC